MSSPLVTIVIPTYNRADSFLPGALQSAIRQGYESLEVLVVDNASTDDTAEVVRAHDHPGLRYIRQPNNVGPFRNFQRGLAEATGEYVLFLCDDDRLDPDFVATCVAALPDDRAVGYVRTGLRTIDENGQPVKDWRNDTTPGGGIEAVLAWMDNRSFWALCNTLYNTSLVRMLGGLPAAYPLTFDCHLSTQLTLTYGSVEVSAVKASFRQHSQQFGRGVEVRQWADEWLALYDLILGTAPRDRRPEVRALGDGHFSSLLFRYAERTDHPLQLLRNYAYVARALGPFRRAPSVRRLVRSTGGTASRWLRASMRDDRASVA
jgi:glycosyltransferase involved in cell wall biosynthesis